MHSEAQHAAVVGSGRNDNDNADKLIALRRPFTMITTKLSNALPASMRFADRVDDYIKARPGYPPQLAAVLTRMIGLRTPATVGDFGAGTGISSWALAEAGFQVIAVEPNHAMRTAGTDLFAGNSRITWIDGSAEACPALASQSLDAWIAAQAFHWFDPLAARLEALRLLKPDAAGATLIWNQRRLSGSPFLEAYEALLLEFGTDYAEVRHDHRDPDRLHAFFGPAGFSEEVLANAQHLDQAGLLARIRSSSYTPPVTHLRHPEMLNAAKQMFATHAQNGRVTLDYDLRVIAGPMR